MTSKPFSTRILGGFFVFAACCSSLHAQTITFDSVTETPMDKNGGLGQYQTIVAGNPQSLDFPAFNVHVSAGTGGAEVLAGADFLGICVNPTYPAPIAGMYNFSLDGSTLTYDADGAGALGDSWADNRTGKYSAIRDIVATFGSTLVGMDQSSLQFQQMITALNFAFADIIVDGPGSLGLTTGNIQFAEANGDPLTDPVASYYQNFIGAIGNGSGSTYDLYAAGIPGTDYQDMILIPIPEPSSAWLIGAAGLMGFIRRRRSA